MKTLLALLVLTGVAYGDAFDDLFYPAKAPSAPVAATVTQPAFLTHVATPEEVITPAKAEPALPSTGWVNSTPYTVIQGHDDAYLLGGEITPVLHAIR